MCHHYFSQRTNGAKAKAKVSSEPPPSWRCGGHVHKIQRLKETHSRYFNTNSTLWLDAKSKLAAGQAATSYLDREVECARLQVALTRGERGRWTTRWATHTHVVCLKSRFKSTGWMKRVKHDGPTLSTHDHRFQQWSWAAQVLTHGPFSTAKETLVF